MAKRLSGINPLSYQGVEPLSPPQSLLVDRAPTINDKNYNIGTFWIVKGTQQIWLLVKLDGGIAIWITFGGGGTGANTFPTDSGIATQVGGVLNVFGDFNILTSGAGNTITIEDVGELAIQFDANSGTAIPVAGVLNVLGSTLFTTSGLANSVVIELLNGTDGQVIIAGGATPIWNNITSLGGTVTITNGPNSINLEAAGAVGSQTYQADVGSATPAGGILNVLGGSNINTTGAGNTINTRLNTNVSISGSWTTGTTITAGTGLTVLSGGIDSTGATTLTSLGAGVMQTTSGGVVFSDNGTNGQVLIGGGSAPAWRNITSTGGTVSITNGPNTINLEVTGSFGRAAFLAVQTSTYTNTFAAPYLMGNNVALTEIYDDASAFFPGNGAGSPAVFTAPATGKYFFSFIANLHTAAAFAGGFETFILKIITTQRTFIYEQTQATALGTDRNETFCTSCDLAVGETAQFSLQLAVTTGSSTWDLATGSSTATLKTFICGFRVL